MSAEDGRRPVEVIGHGGAGDFFPGNSRPAMEKALELGVDRIECDVQRAADGELVLVHDEELALPDGRRRPVRSLSAADIGALLPDLLTFDELVELIAGRAPLMIDIKRSGYEAEVIAAIRRHRLDGDSSLSCTYASTLRRLRHAFPRMRLGLSTGHWATGAPTPVGRALARWALRALVPVPLLVALRVVGATEVMLQHRVATRPLVAAVHAGGRRVNLWTVDRPAAIRRALDLGVDGVISNRPDLVRAIAGGNGGGLRPGSDGGKGRAGADQGEGASP